MHSGGVHGVCWVVALFRCSGHCGATCGAITTASSLWLSSTDLPSEVFIVHLENVKHIGWWARKRRVGTRDKKWPTWAVGRLGQGFRDWAMKMWVVDVILCNPNWVIFIMFILYVFFWCPSCLFLKSQPKKKNSKLFSLWRAKHSTVNDINWTAITNIYSSSMDTWYWL